MERMGKSMVSGFDFPTKTNPWIVGWAFLGRWKEMGRDGKMQKKSSIFGQHISLD